MRADQWRVQRLIGRIVVGRVLKIYVEHISIVLISDISFLLKNDSEIP